MIRVLKAITINGVEVTMLFTPRLFVMAEEQGIKLNVDTANVMATLSAYADMCFCAALNHWTLDNDIEDFKLTRMDFHAWSAANPDEFGRTMVMAAEAVTGKTNSPDLYTVMQILGYERTVARIKDTIASL